MSDLRSRTFVTLVYCSVSTLWRPPKILSLDQSSYCLSFAAIFMEKCRGTYCERCIAALTAAQLLYPLNGCHNGPKQLDKIRLTFSFSIGFQMFMFFNVMTFLFSLWHGVFFEYGVRICFRSSFSLYFSAVWSIINRLLLAHFLHSAQKFPNYRHHNLINLSREIEKALCLVQ